MPGAVHLARVAPKNAVAAHGRVREGGGTRLARRGREWRLEVTGEVVRADEVPGLGIGEPAPIREPEAAGVEAARARGVVLAH
jgi:hypothetical protein